MITSASVLDVLYGLLEAEEGSVFRFMQQGSPYLTRATVETRRRVEELAETSVRNAAELARLIERLGGSVRLAAVHPDNQYLAFLSLKFLLPKLAEAKRRMIERYGNALRALKGAPAEVVDTLQAQLARHREELAVLEAAIPRRSEDKVSANSRE
ncbi:MAG: hypothetical protein JWN40_608 [Phycisphaerales bacterium]|nr:hypothetical protein [Phycisphaerales bacterium]